MLILKLGLWRFLELMPVLWQGQEKWSVTKSAPIFVYRIVDWMDESPALLSWLVDCPSTFPPLLVVLCRDGGLLRFRFPEIESEEMCRARRTLRDIFARILHPHAHKLMCPMIWCEKLYRSCRLLVFQNRSKSSAILYHFRVQTVSITYIREYIYIYIPFFIYIYTYI